MSVKQKLYTHSGEMPNICQCKRGVADFFSPFPAKDRAFVERPALAESMIRPGARALQGGFRREDNYVLRASGPEDLSDYPREL
jgi:hypothetical protein